MALLAARSRTEGLLRPLTEEVLTTPPCPLMSPPIWDLAHIANYEEQWLLRSGGMAPLVAPSVDRLYDAFQQPRSVRGELPLLGSKEAFGYAASVRERVLERLERISPEDSAPLNRGGFVFGMVAQHEQQHAETLCATLQLAGVAVPGVSAAPPEPEGRPARPEGEVLLEGGRFPMGSAAPWGYDNERPLHLREVAPFFIDRAPVTNADFAAFIDEGGYDEPRHWSEAGWRHRCLEGLSAPAFWEQDGTHWRVRRFARTVPLAPDEPVQHVCFYEAEAFAAWAGRRLPTEAEWELAAAGLEGRAYPWGEAVPSERHANLGQRKDGPAPVGTHAEGRTPSEVSGLLGDVWEWTSSPFGPYPGFRPFPYREYSEPFFGDGYRVLRGGSWATAPSAIRNSFRNWDFPIRRQIFAGFRTARTA